MSEIGAKAWAGEILPDDPRLPDGLREIAAIMRAKNPAFRVVG
jgi:hypothetical protein